MKKAILIVIIVLIGSLAGFFLLRKNQKEVSDSGQQKIETSGTASGEEKTLETKEITLIGREFEFNPSVITVSAGQKVKIIFRNEGASPHNFVINGLNVGSKTIPGGQTDIVEFTAPDSGTFEIFCSFPGHKAAGMKGELKVE